MPQVSSAKPLRTAPQALRENDKTSRNGFSEGKYNMSRTCGECSMCCYLFDLPEFNKPKHKWCQHCKPGNGGCSIHNQDRPEICSTYSCLWLLGAIPDEWFPPKSKMILSAHQVGDETICTIVVHHRYPNKWKEEPYYSAIISNAKTHNIFVTCAGKTVYTSCSQLLLQKYAETILAPVARMMDTEECRNFLRHAGSGGTQAFWHPAR